MSFSDSLATELTALGKALNNLDSKILQSSLDEDRNYKDIAEVLFSLYRIKVDIGIIYDTVANLLDTAMADMPEVDLGDGIRIEKKVASDRRAWKHADLATEIARRLMMTNVDIDTGETQKSTEELIAELLRFVQPSYWRVKELATIGVNADNYCEVLEPKTSIIVRKPKDK